MAYLNEGYFGELEEFLDRFKNKDADDCDSYVNTLYEKDSDDENSNIEYDFWDELHKVMTKAGYQYTYQYCGGFDSPGYDISYYCIAFVNPNYDNNIVTVPVKFERF